MRNRIALLLRLFGLAAGLSLCSDASAQIAFDAASSSSAQNVSQRTFSHTVGAAGTNRLLIVGVAVSRNDTTVSSVTYAGSALTLVGVRANTDRARVEIWRLLAPATGTNNVVVTLAASGEGLEAGAASFTGVNQTSPLGSFFSAIGDGTAQSLNVTGVAQDELVIDILDARCGCTATVGAGQTQRWNAIDRSTGAGSTESGPVGGGTVTMSWTTSVSDDWAIAAVAIKPAASTPTVTLSLNGSPMAEAAGVATVTAALSSAHSQDVTVDLAFSGTATLTSDYTHSGTSITIPAGSTSGTMTLTAVQDSIDEAAETIIVDIDTVTNATESGTQQVTATITDDDPPPGVAFDATTSNGNESVTSVNIPVSLSVTSGQTVTVDYAVTGGTASGSGTDFTLASGTLTFNAGTTTQNIALTVVNDSLDEANETIEITLSNPTNASLGSNTLHTYTITDDDAAPTVAFNATSSSGAESATSVTIPVSLSAASGQTISVDYALTGGTASGAGVDYTLASGSLTFTVGETSKNISITVVNDALDEANETIEVTLSNPSNATLGSNTVHTYTITDDDSPPSVAFDVTSSSGAETVTPANLSISLSAASGQMVTVDYAVTGGTATGGGVDFTLASGTLIFSAGQTTKTLPITIVDDTLDEANETIQVTLSSPSNATLGTNTVHTYTITDNDPPPSIGFDVTTASGLESVASVIIPVSVSVVSGQTVMVDYAVTGGTATGSGVDYTLVSGTLTYNPGDLSQNIALTIVNDGFDEANETIQITLSNPVNATLGVNTDHTYTILDEDTTPTVAFNATTSNGAESATSVTIPVSLSAASELTVTVVYGVTGGSATGGGVDYTLASGTLTFTAGTTTQNIAVTVVNDSSDEPDETIEVTLSSPSNATLGANTVHTYTITDDDAPPTVAFDATTSSGLESTTAVTIPVSLSATSSQTITVDFAVIGGSATGGGTDYTLASGTLTFAVGTSSQNISITVVNDALDEADETIQITLSNPGNGTLGTNTVHTYTITDDDPPPSVAFDVTTSNGLESATPANLSVSLSAASGQLVTVEYAVSGGTATGGGVDYTLASGTLIFSAGQTTKTLPITIVDDALDEANETIQVTLANPSNANLGAHTAHTYTVTDDDPPPSVAFDAITSSGLESLTAVTIPVSLSALSGQTVAVDYTVAGGTASGGGVDYTLASGTLIYNPGDLSQNIALTIVNDALNEPSETIQITLSNPFNATLGANTTHIYTITDNDSAPSVAFDATTSSGLESVASVTIAVSLSAAAGQAVTVDYAVTGGTATGSGVDYTLANGTLTFTAGVTSQNIALTVVNDAIDEANETIQITLSNPTNAALGTNTVHTYTITDDDGAPTVAFNAASSSGLESVTTVAVPVSLSVASGQTITVDYAVTGGSASGGGVDYTLASGMLSFSPGETTQNIVLTVANDSLDEADETIQITLSNPSNASLGANPLHTYTITDDDAPPSVAFGSATSSGLESVTSVNIPVSLSAASGQTVTVDYAVTGGTASGGGVDYTLANGTLTFSSGVTAQNIVIAVVNDALAEPSESIQISLSNPSNVTLGATTTHTYTITDDDSAPGLSIGDVTVTEGNSGTVNAVFTITLSAPSGQTVTVDYATANNTATGGASCAAGIDYINTSGTLTFTAGQTTRTATVTVCGDTLSEANETFFVNLSNAANATISGSQAQGTITDDDAAPTVSLSITGASMAEAGGTATVSATLSALSAQTVTIVLSLAGAATLNTDYSLSAASIAIAPGSLTGSATLTAIQDALVEGNETIIVGMAVVTNATPAGTQQVTATIIDDDAPAIALNLKVDDAPDPVQAGGQIIYTLTYSNSSSSNQTSPSATLSSLLPVNTTFVSASGGGSFAAGTVTWSLGDLAPGASGSRTMIVQVAAPLANGTVISHQATLRDMFNNLATATQTTTVQSAALLALAVSDNVDPVAAGGLITYTYTFSNTSTASQTALATMLAATLPNDTTFVSASNGGTLAAGVVSWSIGDLAPGASGTRTLVVQVNAPLVNGTLISEDAAIQDAALNSANANQTTTVQNTPLLALSVSDSPDPVQAGGQLTYTLSYRNTSVGNQTALAVTLTNTLPANTTLVAASNGGSFTGNVVTWNIGSLAPGASGSRTLIVRVASPLANGTLINNFATLRDGSGQSANSQVSTTVGVVATVGGGGGNIFVPIPTTPVVPNASGFADSAAPTQAIAVSPVSEAPAALPLTITRPAAPAQNQMTSLPTRTLDGCSSTSKLLLTGSHNPKPALAAGQITYTFNFANQSSGDSVRNVYLVSRLPEVMSAVFASNGGETVGDEIQWKLGDLPPGASGQRTLVARIAHLDPGTTLLVNNHAYLDDGQNLCAQTIEATPIKTPSFLDKDNDGFPDADELTCGSDPRNSQSICYDIDLSESHVRIARNATATITARVHTSTRFAGAVTLAAENALRGAMWHLAEPVVTLTPAAKTVSTTITLQTTSGTSLGLHHVPIWARSGAMTQMKLLLIEVLP